MIPKLLALCFLVLVSALPTLAQPSAVNIEGMNGEVKRVDEKESTTTVKDGKTKEDFDSFSHFLVFDKSGRLTYATYSFEGSSTEKRYFYDKDGVRKCASQTTRPFNRSTQEPPPSFSASVFKFNAGENTLTEDTYTPKLQSGPVFELNDLGQRYKYVFDKTNRLIKKIVLSSDGREVMTFEYFFRSTGFPSDLVITSGGRALQMLKYTYEVDSHGNWTKRTAEERSTNPQFAPRTRVTYRKISYFNK